MIEAVKSTLLFAEGGLSDIKPDYNFFPWNNTLKSIISGVSGSVLILIVGAFIISIVCIVFGTFSKSQILRNIGIGVLVIDLAAAAGVTNAGGIIDWSSNLNILNQQLSNNQPIW